MLPSEVDDDRVTVRHVHGARAVTDQCSTPRGRDERACLWPRFGGAFVVRGGYVQWKMTAVVGAPAFVVYRVRGVGVCGTVGVLLLERIHWPIQGGI